MWPEGQLWKPGPPCPATAAAEPPGWQFRGWGPDSNQGWLQDGAGHGADEAAGQGDVAAVFSEGEVGDFGHPFF